jgi:hypothetical protein
MSLGFRVRRIMTGAAVLLSAASAAVLAAPGASAATASHLSMSVLNLGQGYVGDQCNWDASFNVTITSSSSGPVTVTAVNGGNYNLFHNGGLAAGTVLQPGTNTFTKLEGSGPAVGQPCPNEAPAPLVLTVTTSAGSVTWNQSVSDPQVVTMMGLPQGEASAVLAGSFDVAKCSKYHFEYGTTTAYGHRVDVSSADCPNDGTQTEIIGFTATGLKPGTGYHYRFVVVQSDGKPLYGLDVQFLTGGTPVPVGGVGIIGVAALAGAALFITTLRRRRSRTAH